MPSRLGPNRSYEFSVVLDFPHEASLIVLNTTFDGGWDWRYDGI